MTIENELEVLELPEGYTEKGCIYDASGNQVTNGIIRLTGYYKMIEETSYYIIKVRFSTHNGNTNATAEIPFSVIESKKLYQYVPEGFLFLFDSDTKGLRFFQKTLKLSLEKTPLSEVYILHPGYNQLPDGSYVYGLGKTILNHKSTPLLTTTSNAEIKSIASIQESYIDWNKKFFQQSEHHPALFISATVSLTRPLLHSIGIKDLFAIYLVGESGNGKSEYAKLLTDIFEMHDSCRSLSSSQVDLLRTMNNHRDFLFLIDDLNKSASARVKDKKEATLSELIQQISSGGSIEYRGELFHANTMILITAEYIIKNYSSINRCLIIEQEKSFNPESLTWLQKNQSLYIHFLLDYITWICQNFQRLIQYLHVWISNLKPFVVKDQQAYVGFYRIARTYTTLQLATELYLLFLKDEYRIPDPSINKLRTQIISSVDNCIAATLEAVRKNDSAKGRHYVDVILNYFKLPGDSIVNSYTEYKKIRKQKNRQVTKGIFFREGDCYCIAGDDLVALFSIQNDFPYTITKKSISAQFKYHGLLKIKDGSDSYPLRGNSGKKRYYHLYVNAIIDLLQETLSPGEFNICKSISPIPELQQ